MSHIVFFEKPGCGGNTRQRAALLAAGHTLERRNLLTAHWTREKLLEFFAPLPVAQWFNTAAPRVKSGELKPEALSPDAALELLLNEPLLIRRPLMHNTADNSRRVGFDTADIAAWIGLAPSARRTASLEGCASPQEPCSTPPHGGIHAAV
jgi:nitrogenase-associated protein